MHAKETFLHILCVPRVVALEVIRACPCFLLLDCNSWSGLLHAFFAFEYAMLPGFLPKSASVAVASFGAPCIA